MMNRKTKIVIRKIAAAFFLISLSGCTGGLKIDIKKEGSNIHAVLSFADAYDRFIGKSPCINSIYKYEKLNNSTTITFSISSNDGKCRKINDYILDTIPPGFKVDPVDSHRRKRREGAVEYIAFSGPGQSGEARLS